MIELKKEFSKKGVNFKQIFKDDELIIYRLEDGDLHWYEIFQRKVCPPDIYHNDEFEKYPYDEAFGLWAWCSSNEGSVAKVLNLHFKEHPLAKMMDKFVIGTYKVNGVDRKRYKLSSEELLFSISNYCTV